MEDAVPTILAYAAQTGRLDFISALLAVLAIILGLGAFPVFFFVQRRAENIAREVAESILKDALERIENDAISRVERMLPKLVEEYGELARNAVNETIANEIAAAQETGKNGENDRPANS
ncbi:MAG: hypothetical protein KDF64_17300 [Geminicoccaceae bacterium]|nr:hypothetical protein [Geminicoccaceae bacterium]